MIKLDLLSCRLGQGTEIDMTI